MEWLRILRNQAAVLKVHFEELSKLNSAIVNIEAFQVGEAGARHVALATAMVCLELKQLMGMWPAGESQRGPPSEANATAPA